MSQLRLDLFFAVVVLVLCCSQAKCDLTITDYNATTQYTTTLPTTTEEVTRPPVVTFPEITITEMPRHRLRLNQYHEHHYGPFFEEPEVANSGQAVNVSFYKDSNGELNCRVGMLRDKTVTWLRRMHDKVALLTVGETTYTGDLRLSVKFQYPNNWKLIIKGIKLEDAGLYMCQVSTYPPRVLITNVTVLPPALVIVDELGRKTPDIYYRTNSAIELTCQVATLLNLMTKAKTENTQLVWFKDGEQISTNQTKLINSPHWFGLRLNLRRSKPEDSGTYSCQLTNISTVSIRVHVLDEETQAAVQHKTHFGAANVLKSEFGLFYASKGTGHWVGR
ncbi:zwei Ig domain protein zig-8-like [Ctenocephalides felis]|uniref:zwei Ig domain protein zig-8-like n=1 Tax=Ctenocephalides felis TaxID=7515 RepID=UPI000E6E4E7C|nr:zwei Ig domain protein zig-8-like [Ctenocephalides felis]